MLIHPLQVQRVRWKRLGSWSEIVRCMVMKSIPVNAENSANCSAPGAWSNRDRYPRPTLLYRV